MSTQQLGEIGALARLLVEATVSVEDAEAVLTRAKENKRRIEEESLPGAMAELGLTELTLEDGSKISVAPECYVSIPVASKGEALRWLEDNEFGGLIKTSIELPFGRSDEEKEALGALKVTLNKAGYTYTESAGVHAGTLKAWAKEQLREGREFPLQLFGARPVTLAKVKLPKGK